MDEITINQWMRPDRVEPFAALTDGTALYPAYYPVRPGEAYRRQMGMWTGQTGEWVGVTLDGQLYQQERLWGNEPPQPDRWKRFTLGGW
jgi:hypothetical protein